jgi:hypothetical protein
MWAAFFSGRSSLTHNALIGFGVSLAFWGVAAALATQSWTTGPQALQWAHAAAWWTFLATLWATTWAWTAWLSATLASENGLGLGPAIAGMTANIVLAVALGLLTGDRMHLLLSVWHGHAVEGMSEVGIRYLPAGPGEVRGHLVLTGDLGPGSTERLARALAQHPQVRRLRMESPRGLVTEAMAMGRQVQDLGLDTSVGERCVGACAIVFMAGAGRWLAPEGQLAFHQTHAPVLPFLRRFGLADERVLAFYLEQGVPLHLAEAMVSAPSHQVWVPDGDTLLVLGIRRGP